MPRRLSVFLASSFHLSPRRRVQPPSPASIVQYPALPAKRARVLSGFAQATRQSAGWVPASRSPEQNGLRRRPLLLPSPPLFDIHTPHSESPAARTHARLLLAFHRGPRS